MSASLLVDLGNTCQMGVSIQDTALLSGSFIANGSGTIIGQTVDMLNADTYTNLYGAGVSASGRLRLQVQVSDSDTSGNFFDPTSGFSQLPGAFQSGTILWINSGLDNGTLGPIISGHCIASGWMEAQGFIRPGRYARVNVLSEASAQYAGALNAGFIGNYRTTGSGGGFSFSPSSGSVNV